MKKISHFKKTLIILGIGIIPFYSQVYASNEIANTIADNKEAQFQLKSMVYITLKKNTSLKLMLKMTIKSKD